MSKITSKQMGIILNDLRRTFTVAFPAASNKEELDAVKSIWMDHFGKYDHEVVNEAARLLRVTAERPTLRAMQDLIYQNLGIVPSLTDLRSEIESILRGEPAAASASPAAALVMDQAGGIFYLNQMGAREAHIAVQTVINSVRESAIMMAIKGGK